MLASKCWPGMAGLLVLARSATGDVEQTTAVGADHGAHTGGPDGRYLVAHNGFGDFRVQE